MAFLTTRYFASPTRPLLYTSCCFLLQTVSKMVDCNAKHILESKDYTAMCFIFSLSSDDFKVRFWVFLFVFFFPCFWLFRGLFVLPFDFFFSYQNFAGACA